MKGTNALLTSAVLLASKRHVRTICEKNGGGIKDLAKSRTKVSAKSFLIQEVPPWDVCKK